MALNFRFLIVKIYSIPQFIGKRGLLCLEMESKRKPNKPKDNRFPVNRLAFYIKVYCKQKGSSESKYQNNLVEATKSWLSLTEEEKQQVHESYKEEEHKFKQQCFNQLKNAEAFMKARDPMGVKDVELNTTSSIIKEPEVHMIEESLQTLTEQANETVNEEGINFSFDEESVTDKAPEHDQEEDCETITEPIQQTNEETPKTIQVEPLPPSIKSGKDLFYMLNTTVGTENVSWTQLPTSDKNQYKRAVSLLKSDYISKYKNYLESLTPRELYDYYNKTLF